MNAVTTTAPTGVATVDASNPYAAYAAEASSRNIVGTLLKFSKGEWSKGQNDLVVPLGTKMVVDMRNIQVGWIRWSDKKPAQHLMGRIADGHRPPGRDTLGYSDKNEWEIDTTGKPQDPWQLTSIAFLMDTAGEIYTYSPSSAGGRNAIINLCGVYGKQMRQHPGELPIVELGVDSYRHDDYGKVHVPVLKIVGWHSEKDFDEAQAAEEAEAKARAENAAADKGETSGAAGGGRSGGEVVDEKPPQVDSAKPAADSGFGFKKGAAAKADVAPETPKKATRF